MAERCSRDDDDKDECLIMMTGHEKEKRERWDEVKSTKERRFDFMKLKIIKHFHDGFNDFDGTVISM